MSESSGRIWPYAIGIAITLVFSFCIATVFITESSQVQESDAYMTHYQDADINANKLIHARILFDKKYNISYLPEKISGKNPLIKYKITDKNSLPVEKAILKIKISRPETKEFNQEIDSPTVKDGVYTFSGAKFAKAGVWNIILKVQIGDDTRFYNIKADTRNANFYEY